MCVPSYDHCPTNIGVARSDDTVAVVSDGWVAVWVALMGLLHWSNPSLQAILVGCAFLISCSFCTKDHMRVKERERERAKKKDLNFAAILAMQTLEKGLLFL